MILLKSHSLRRGLFACACLLFLSGAPEAARAQSGSDIHLISIRGGGEEHLGFGAPRNVTLRVGYDNQPFFLPSSDGIYFTSILPEGPGGTTQADIFRYDLAEDRVVRVTDTPESEYSPTPLPDGGFSTVRVEADSTQRLWEFDGEGKNPRVVLEDVQGIGYHAWGSPEELVLFVLGDPHELHRAGRGRAGSTRVAVDIGRALHVIPYGLAWSFTQQVEPGDWRIRALNASDGTIEDIAPAYGGVQDYTWTPWGTIWLAQGSTLFEWDPKAQRKAWRRLHDFSANGLTRITRIDVSSDGKWLAAVALEPPAAAAEDVASLDAILKALCDVVSSPAGVEFDADRMRSLFSPAARLIGVGRASDGSAWSRSLTLEDWIGEVGSQLENLDFTESETGRRVETWGHLAQVWRGYEIVVRRPEGERRFEGLSSIQLRQEGDRWFVESMLFEAETEEEPLPGDLGGRPDSDE